MRSTKTLLVLGLIALPASVLALNYTDSSRVYGDSPFSKAESAAISLLSNEGVVEGNPDGKFHPERTLNRAEFVKIALEMRNISISSSANQRCFPDVGGDDWYVRYVCHAKKIGLVEGYTDGLFHPDRPVIYAEAVKILAAQYGYENDTRSDEQWYAGWLRAAQEHGTELPINLSFDHPLTRGQMARLAAAFLAESKDELALYRAAEKGETIRSSASSLSSVSSASSVSSVSSAMSSSSLSSSTSSSSSANRAQSHLLLLSKETPAVIDGVFTSVEEDATLRLVSLWLRREVKSVDKMYLVDQSGKKLFELFLETDDTDKRKWKSGTTGTGITLAKGAPTVLGIRMLLKPTGSGVPEELVEFERFSIDVSGVPSAQSRQLVPTDQRSPMHQTALAALRSVKNTLSANGTLQTGSNRQIAAFTFSGVILPGATINLSELSARLELEGVTVSNVRIGGPSEVQQASCSFEGFDATRVFCPVIPDMVKYLESGTGRILSLYATVMNAGNGTHTLRAYLESAGAIGQNGAVRWTDGTGRFTWIESNQFPVSGTKWTVTP